MILKTNRQKAIYAGAASFLLSVASSALVLIGLTVLSMVFAAAASGFYMLTLMVAPSGKKLYFIVPIASAICATVINSFSVPVGIISLSPFIAGHLMARAAERGTGKAGAIIRADAAVFLTCFAALAVAFAIENKTIAPSAVAEAIRTFVADLKTNMENALEQINFYDLMSGVIDLSSYTKEQFIGDIITEIFFFGEIIIPSVIITLLNAFAYLGTAFFSLGCRISKSEQDGAFGKWRLMPSHITSSLAVSSMMIYIVLTVLSNLASSSVLSVISYVVLNIVIILTPPMFICGVRGIAGKFRSPRFRGSAILVTALAVGATVILPIYGFFYGVMFVALQGAWDMILFYRIQKIKSREDEENDENDV